MAVKIWYLILTKDKEEIPMTKTTSEINIRYFYEPNRSRVKYSLDGEKWINGGDFAEIANKASKGLAPEKDGNTPYDKGSDIEETHTSVKSSKAALTQVVIGNSFETILRNYFAHTASNNWDWTVIIDNTVTIYNMNRPEFERFVRQFGYYEEARQIIRFKATTGKMIKWLEENL
jgi:hypothetical protein